MGEGDQGEACEQPEVIYFHPLCTSTFIIKKKNFSNMFGDINFT